MAILVVFFFSSHIFFPPGYDLVLFFHLVITVRLPMILGMHGLRSARSALCRILYKKGNPKIQRPKKASEEERTGTSVESWNTL